MNWGRAKTILILSFFFLNVVLGYLVWTGKAKQTELATDMTGVLEETNKLLKGKSIQLSHELPKEAPKLKEITFKFVESYQPNVTLKLQYPFKIASLLNRISPKDDLPKTDIPKLDAYKHDPILSKKGMYVLNQMYNEYPMFDVQLKLYETDAQITSYRQAYVEVESGGEDKEQKVIPAYIAVRSLVEKFLLDGSVITDVRLGYHGQLFDSQTQYMVPNWRVTINNGDIYYVHAFNGAVEMQSASAEEAAADTKK
ncbi:MULTISPECIES: two-component system regulatory protein YycI [unclassified Paenibacillus]|uniref:two-component system regulatory protein YycI n=1 Tax=unclassified Paenibacillus TaxID=185978 RepID=UPI00020D7230|nr:MULTISPECIES: two-component system regulatory protein YycI [unclassified Paenibacillus]EGL18146.1 YycH protein [Paenibacillus sp. HGF7]EPD88135.1 hypothetical protein HMPREF1207_02677 [Paenibacillus sp. HGH0039]